MSKNDGLVGMLGIEFGVKRAKKINSPESRDVVGE
jgi:hypothetical protein